VGAYTSYKLATNVPQIPVMLDFFIGGLVAAVVGVVFGLPSVKMRALQIWSVLPQIADIDPSREDLSVGPIPDLLSKAT
jgi:hypothetical protein